MKEQNKAVSEELWKIFENVSVWLSHAELKNAALVALHGTVFAFIYDKICFVLWRDRIAFLLMVGSLFLALFSFVPKKDGWLIFRKWASGITKRKNVIFYADIMVFQSATDYLHAVASAILKKRDLRDYTPSKYEADLAEEIRINSVITQNKCQIFKWALTLFMVGILVLASKLAV